jgi:biotin carboxyl carrier protein
MSLYNVMIENREYRVDITGDRCTVNGEPIDATVVALNHNGLQLLRNGKRALEVFLTTQDDDTYQMVMLGGRKVVSRITNRSRRRGRAGAAEEHGNALHAPMHGLVVDVSATEGQEVEKGQTLVVLESMKMQMQLRSPRAGRVGKVAVQTGSQVEKGAVLVQFEE